MKEIETLIQRAERAIKSAELLFEERDFDSSVSRSYYAMFYATEALLLTKDLKFSSHRSVISLFGEHFIKTGILKSEMGKRLSKTFEKRLVGDYSFAPEVNQEEAKEVVSWTKEFLKEIKDYLVKGGYTK
ncbi:MAG: HEPN domain-containing protein [candidate division Zixibacteria bacterium]|nr:HEPN domain-containing protein [candidate division Zixibacteria bacterium]